MNYVHKTTFKAGKMAYDSTTQKVTADPRPGTVIVYHDMNNEKHFQWVDSANQLIENDLYIFQGDAQFSWVPQAEGRVCLLSFQSYEDKLFFWFQEEDPAKDEDYVK